MPTQPDVTAQSPYRRLGEKIFVAFRLACEQGDREVAVQLYGCLELLMIHYADADEADHQAQLSILAEAQAELAALDQG